MKTKKIKKVVFISGIFNVIHPGHIRLMRFAKTFGDKLVVGVYSKKISKQNAYFSDKQRFESVKSNSLVDKCIIINNSLTRTLNKIKPDFVVKGKEFEKLHNEEKNYIKKSGAKLIFSSGKISLTSIEDKFYLGSAKKFILPENYLQRHNIKRRNLKKIIKNFSKLNIAVFGDVIVDEYISCASIGLSQEDPTMVVTPINNTFYLGGAGIVSLHAKKLGASVNFFSVVGNDDNGSYVKKILKKHNVNFLIEKDIGRPTTHKKKFRVYNKNLLKVNTLIEYDIPSEIQKKILKKFKKIIDKLNLIVFSDFNYGCLPQNLVDEITNLAIKKNIIIVADCQASSQFGNIRRYKNLELITPTEYEARLSLQNTSDGLVVLGDKLLEKTNSKNIIITLGADGILIQSSQKNNNFHTDKLPSFNPNPIDTTGAGDSLMITSGMSLAVGANIFESSIIGNLAAAVQVDTFGNEQISSSKLLKYL